MKPEVKREIREWVDVIVKALILALIVRTFVVAAFKIPTGSMKPTLTQGDKIFVNKFIYKFKPMRRGDIVVFKFPENPKKAYVKRLIAFAEETVEIRDGRIFIDGEVIEGPKIVVRYYYNKDPYGSHGKKIKVPEGHFYVLGDNSANSRDSREWGFVPRRNLIGKAFLIWWPPKRIKLIK